MHRETRVLAAAMLSLLCFAEPSRARTGTVPAQETLPGSVSKSGWAPQPPAEGSSPGALALGRQDFFWVPAMIAAGVYSQVRYNDMAPADTGSLNRGADLWLIDRWAAGLNSPGAALASSLMLAPMLALPLAATAWESHTGRQTWSAAATDAFIFGEALMLSSSLNLIVRSTRVHPRPYVYARDVPAKDRLKGEASGSFYSGHANAAFLSAVYFSYTRSLRHPDADHQGLIWAGSLGAATAVASVRVAAGRHFLSDVLMGAAIGSLFGWGFPYLHRRGGISAALGLGSDGTGVHPVLSWTF